MLGDRLGNRFGIHRALVPQNTLPQIAEKLDADLAKHYEHEVHLVVETLNVDSASMHQMTTEVGEDSAGVGARIAHIVADRGKLHNPVTGSGGMLLGRVDWIGDEAQKSFPKLATGDRVATLVSLTLTPLSLSRVAEVRLATHQVDVEGSAVVFSSGMLAPLPDDMPESLSLAAFDVAGAGPQVLRLARPGQSVLILGVGGKSGLLCALAARWAVGAGGTVIGVEPQPDAAAAAESLGLCASVVRADATDAIATREAVLACARQSVVDADGFDLVVSCVNVAGAEPTAILLCRPRGKVYFFSMATSFARAALVAEGISRDVDMVIGNGYCADHAQTTLELIRHAPDLRKLFEARFC